MIASSPLIAHVKRLALAAILSGAAIAATPALANAASTCTFSPNAFPESRVDVSDGSGSLSLTVGRQGPFIRITDAGIPPGGTFTSTSTLCPAPDGTLASIFNTDEILVHGTASSTEEFPFIVDAGLAPGKTPESDGNSELETVITNNGVPVKRLAVEGTGAADTMRVSAGSGVMLGPDNDVDIRVRDGAQIIRLEGKGGPDFLSGRGGYPNSSPAPATTRVELFGGDAGFPSDTSTNTLVDGPLPNDFLQGAEGNDTLFSVDGQQDVLAGGLGFDTATVDASDVTFSVEQLTTVAGRLKLNPVGSPTVTK